MNITAIPSFSAEDSFSCSHCFLSAENIHSTPASAWEECLLLLLSVVINLVENSLPLRVCHELHLFAIIQCLEKFMRQK